jgi:hypothetical protein
MVQVLVVVLVAVAQEMATVVAVEVQAILVVIVQQKELMDKVWEIQLAVAQVEDFHPLTQLLVLL